LFQGLNFALGDCIGPFQGQIFGPGNCTFICPFQDPIFLSDDCIGPFQGLIFVWNICIGPFQGVFIASSREKIWVKNLFHFIRFFRNRLCVGFVFIDTFLSIAAHLWT